MINWLEKNRKISIIFLVIIAIEIFVISSIPGSGIISTGFNLAWLYHFAVFFLFNFFLLTSIIGNKKISRKKLILAIIFSLTYAILDEIHQIFVPLRTASIIDVLTDFAGIFVCSLIYMRYSWTKRKKLQ